MVQLQEQPFTNSTVTSYHLHTLLFKCLVHSAYFFFCHSLLLFTHYTYSVKNWQECFGKFRLSCQRKFSDHLLDSLIRKKIESYLSDNAKVYISLYKFSMIYNIVVFKMLIQTKKMCLNPSWFGVETSRRKNAGIIYHGTLLYLWSSIKNNWIL